MTDIYVCDENVYVFVCVYIYMCIHDIIFYTER